MNFVLISPVGADVDLMPKTRPGWTTGTSVSTPTPRRYVHRLLLPHCRMPRVIRFLHGLRENTRTERISPSLSLSLSLSINWRTPRTFRSPRRRKFPFSFALYRFPGPLSLLSLSAINGSTFTATYATQHIITTTIYPNAAGCGHRERLTTNHRPSAMANDMSLLSRDHGITGFGDHTESRDLAVCNIESCACSFDVSNHAFRLRIHPYRNKESAIKRAPGPSSHRAHPIVVPARKLGDGEPGDGTRREKRRAWPLSGVRSRFLRTSRIVDESFMGHA